MSTKDIFSLMASMGRPEQFNMQLVRAFRRGSLDPEACAWLADFFEKGGAGELKFTITRSRPGNPRQRKRINIGAVWRFRMITEECRTKEEAFARAKNELNIGKKRAEEYWVRIKEDIAAAAEEPWKGEAYQGWKEAVAQEEATTSAASATGRNKTTIPSQLNNWEGMDSAEKNRITDLSRHSLTRHDNDFRST